MNQSANKIFRHFAGNRSLQETSVEKLKTLSAAYPYFPVSQFFLAKKLKDEEDEAYLAQSQKAVLYFANPFLFDFLLNTEVLTNSSTVEPEEAIHYDFEADKDAVVDETISTSETNAEVATIVQNEEKKVEKIFTSEEIVASSKEFENISANEPKAETEFSEEIKKETKTEKPIEREVLPPTDEPDEHERMFRSIKAMLDATSEEANADVNDTDIPIDPYYTIDYFASQGIQLDLENPQDKLGQNLKRFTQWLRHMKKLGPEDAKSEIENTTSEADIQKMADTSNTVKEVVTEAMAAVLEKQGKKGKAIELYTKLSFLNPGKSTYFAAQIEKLKV